MPVKRRRPKRRMTEAELTAWSGLFECGYDFFDDLDDIGIFGTDAEKAAAAAEAWQRLGGLFTERRQQSQTRAVPWALEQFGEPRTGGGGAG